MFGGGHVTTRSAKPKIDFVVRNGSVAIVPKFNIFVYVLNQNFLDWLPKVYKCDKKIKYLKYAGSSR